MHGYNRRNSNPGPENVATDIKWGEKMAVPMVNEN